MWGWGVGGGVGEGTSIAVRGRVSGQVFTL